MESDGGHPSSRHRSVFPYPVLSRFFTFLAARIGDLVGRKALWLIALVFGALGAALCAGANSVGMAILGCAPRHARDRGLLNPRKVRPLWRWILQQR
jgi:MFS family permease